MENELQQMESEIEEIAKKKEPTIAEQRRLNARHMFWINLVLAIISFIGFAGGIVLISIGSFSTKLEQFVVAILCIAGIFLLAFGAVFTLYFVGHLVQCVRDMQDPERKNAKDEKI